MNAFDDELRAHFRDLRDDDATTAPPFATMGIEIHARPHRRVWGLAAAAVLLLASGALALRSRSARRDDNARIRLDVLNWRAPTDALLRDSRIGLGGATGIFGSVLDGAAAGATATDSSTRGSGT
jgi:hypothetical protein